MNYLSQEQVDALHEASAVPKIRNILSGSESRATLAEIAFRFSRDEAFGGLSSGALISFLNHVATQLEAIEKLVEGE